MKTTRHKVRVKDILGDPKSEFQLALSPYIVVSVGLHGPGSPIVPPQSIDPVQVRAFNDMIRRQCSIFTLARDKESLV